jgi:hypothetical protein
LLIEINSSEPIFTGPETSDSICFLADVKLKQLNQIFNVLNPLFQDYLILQAKELFKVQEKRTEGENGPSSNPG